MFAGLVASLAALSGGPAQVAAPISSAVHAAAHTVGNEGQPGSRLDARVAAMSRRQLAGQRVVFSFAGTRTPAGLIRRISRGEAGAVILFDRNISSRGQLRRLTRRLQRAAPNDAPVLVMVDEEGGAVSRVPGTNAPSATSLGGRSPRASFRAGRAVARSLRGVGVNVDLAPVADVPRAGSAIGREGRSFGSSAARVSARAVRFARGLRRGGIAAAAKHFPGFGAARVNTDFQPQTIRLSGRALRRVDLVPFRALVRARVPLVMLSTAVYPAFDSRPAALSRSITRALLRGRLGFRGVSISDDLETPAVARYGGPPELALRAARAETDLIMFARSYRAGVRAARGLRAALRSGRLSRSGLARGARRVLALRRSLRR